MPAKIGIGKALSHGSTGPDFKTVEDEIGYWIDRQQQYLQVRAENF